MAIFFISTFLHLMCTTAIDTNFRFVVISLDGKFNIWFKKKCHGLKCCYFITFSICGMNAWKQFKFWWIIMNFISLPSTTVNLTYALVPPCVNWIEWIVSPKIWTIIYSIVITNQKIYTNMYLPSKNVRMSCSV